MVPVAVIGGFAGSGKSSLAASLSCSLGLPMLESDRIGKALYRLGNGGLSSREAHRIARQAVFDQLESCVAHVCGAVIEIDLAVASVWDRLASLLDRYQSVQARVFLLDCPFELCAERVEIRRRENPDYYILGRHNVGLSYGKWAVLRSMNFPSMIRLDARRPVRQVADAALWRMGRKGCPVLEAVDATRAARYLRNTARSAPTRGGRLAGWLQHITRQLPRRGSCPPSGA